jgi:hypothetical protein
MGRVFPRNVFGPAFLAAMLLLGSASAQYKATQLVSNLPGIAVNQDQKLVNAWGLARGASSPFWVSA